MVSISLALLQQISVLLRDLLVSLTLFVFHSLLHSRARLVRTRSDKDWVVRFRACPMVVGIFSAARSGER